MHAQSNPGAAEFLPQQARQKTCLTAGKWFFEIFLVIQFVLNCLKVHYDTLRCLAWDRSISYQEWMKWKSMPERLSEYVILICFRKSLIFFRKLQKWLYMIYRCFRRTCEQACLLQSLYKPFRQWQFTGGLKYWLPGDREVDFLELFFNSFSFKLSRGRLRHYLL